MTGIPLQIAEPTGRYTRSLRKFTFGGSGPETGPCPHGYHNASTVIGEVPEAEAEQVRGDTWPHDDPRWPVACGQCGTEFAGLEQVQWQRNDDAVYRLPDGTEFTFSRSLGMCAPPGTMIRIPYYDEFAEVPGESWLVALPDGGDWITTQRASGGGHWTVTGTPPAITASPSIWHNSPHGWHGWVRDGRLERA